MSNKINWPAWIRSWPCIEKNCDNHGTITGAVMGRDGYPEPSPEPCQFCDEREKLARHVEWLEEERAAEPKDAAFNAFMAGLGPSRWEGR